jgi:hypothetical protein
MRQFWILDIPAGVYWIIMYKNSQTANNMFHLTLFNQEVKLPVSVRMQDHHQVFTSSLISIMKWIMKWNFVTDINDEVKTWWWSFIRTETGSLTSWLNKVRWNILLAVWLFLYIIVKWDVINPTINTRLNVWRLLKTTKLSYQKAQRKTKWGTNFFLYLILWDRHIVVAIATRYRLDGSGFKPWSRQEILPCPRPSWMAVGLTQPLA